MSYTTQQSAHSTHTLTATDGSRSTAYKRYEQGIISGRYRDVLVVLADNTGFDGNGFDASAGSLDDDWYVLNAFDDRDKYIDTVAVGGAMDEDHAVQVATSYFTNIGASYFAVISSADTSDQPATWSIDAITKLLSNPSQDAHYLRVITAKELRDEIQRVTYDSVKWQGDFTLASHGGSISDLCHDILKTDTHQDILTSFNINEAFADLNIKPVGDTQFDSLMEVKSRLPILKDRLFKAMANVAVEGVAVSTVKETKPFKRAGTVNMAFVFKLSDGQSLSIWFHSPKETPSNVLPTDIMVSWKWMLNKRDVTAVLSPPNGDNVQLPTLAGRIMRLAAKNSKRFKAAQVRAQKLDKELEEAQAEVDEKREALTNLDSEIAELQDKINAAIKTPVPVDDKPTQVPQTAAEVGADDVEATINELSTDLDTDDNIVTITGTEIDVSDAVDFKTAKNNAMAYFDDNLKDKVIFCPAVKNDVILRRRGGKHIAKANHTFRSKLQLVAAIPEMIKKGKYESYTKAVKGKAPNIYGYYVLHVTVVIDDIAKNARVVLEKNNEGEVLYDIGINKKEALAALGDAVADESSTRRSVSSQYQGLDKSYQDESDGVKQFDKLSFVDTGEYVLNLFFDEDILENLKDEDASNQESVASPIQPITTGKTNNAKTVGGNKIASTFALVEANSLIASHNASGAENPNYPQELQPRDRSRSESIAWVQKMAKSLDPESLGRTRRVDAGAPIVSDDLVVESGNGRTIAIKLAYQNGDAEEYREYLSDNAAMFGFSAEQVAKYKHPVLVRIRKTAIDRVAFTIEANQDDKLSFTASERAKSDAKRISDDMLALLSPSESGDLLAASNREFIKKFLASLGAEEAAQYTDNNGAPTRALEARVKAAIFNKAYDDDRLLEMMADQASPELQNTLNALTQAAPKFVEARATNLSQAQDAAESLIDGIEQTLDDQVQAAISDAANMIMNAKKNDQGITEYVRQLGLFEDVEDGVAELAVFLAQNARSAKKMTALFTAMADYIKNDNTARQNLDMFGAPAPLSINDVVRHALNAVQPTKTENLEDTPMTTALNDDAPNAATPVTDISAEDGERGQLKASIDALERLVNSADYDVTAGSTDELLELNKRATALDDGDLLNQLARISQKTVELTTAAIMRQMQQGAS
ncbi:hypothetical protein [Psychrobacter aestuarii]|uniref:Defence against restriction A N-terminal domain-containing protein n=1 Tax=Psychrobacter aestuarii TaxID=556327 RepID=A0ABP3FLS5_9GAMM|nr:hypothetical protein [Psychrobacter aestuarii]